MARTYVYPVGEDRDSLILHRIDNNDTIQAMVETINANFENIARHGGGPAGIDGINGADGVDGKNVEYIFARFDEPKANVNYPTTNLYDDGGEDSKEFLFDQLIGFGVEEKSYNGVVWYDHPQGISAENTKEYVLSRYRREDDQIWIYQDKPVLWSQWGEKGKDGDGVEYIFLVTDHELDASEKASILVSNSTMTDIQTTIYNIDDFYPNTGWFNTNKTKISDALIEHLGYSDAEVASVWGDNIGKYFNMVAKKDSVYYNWTDDPTGTSYENKYEYVSIRRSKTNDIGKKEWSDWSEPALWSNYTTPTRMFMVYCNMPVGVAPKPLTVGTGFWLNDENNDKLVNSKNNPSDFKQQAYPGVRPDGLDSELGWWVDNDIDYDDECITWLCSGVFTFDGSNVSWSSPMRITGANGQRGEDGTLIEFIYTISPEMVAGIHYPSSPGTDNKNYDDIFYSAEHPDNPRDGITIGTSNGFKYVDFNGTHWYDRAQVIEDKENKRTEWVWQRIKKDENSDWVYSGPMLWAHWGEDGTDGDGVEYIFNVTTTDEAPDLPVLTGEFTEYKNAIYQMDDFYPGASWFTGSPTSNDKHYKKVYDKISSESWFNKSTFDAQWTGNGKFGLDKDWTDNPTRVSPSNPYEWVSVRKTDTPEGAKNKHWGEFSEPTLWSYYGKRTRVFIVYCNILETDTIVAPTGGWWDVEHDKLVKDRTHLNQDFTPKARPNEPTQEEIANDIGFWQDNNKDKRGYISYMCSGLFVEGDENPKWADPYRITGDKGNPGKDGENIEFIYALSDSAPIYPKPVIVNGEITPASYATICTFFDAVEAADSEYTENPQGYPATENSKQTYWFDNPQGIKNEDGKRTEWVWQRSKKAGATADDPWIIKYKPTIWSRWGEDGTDGDGVEYIFNTDTAKQLPPAQNPNITFAGENTTLGKYERFIYQMDDFYPGTGWFDNPETDADNKTIKDIVEEGLKTAEIWDDSVDWNTIWGQLRSAFNRGWTDEPADVTAAEPFLHVAIRKYHKNTWGEFSDPSIWGKYNINTRLFIVYCNMDGDTIPVAPTTDITPDTTNQRYCGFWDVNGSGNTALLTTQGGVPFKSNALADGILPTGGNNVSDWDDNIGYWQDDNIDVPGMTAWMCTGIFSESNGYPISWSEVHRLTGEQGRPGADGSNIEFIYTLNDNKPAYPQYDSRNSNQSLFSRRDLFYYIENPNNPEDDSDREALFGIANIYASMTDANLNSLGNNDICLFINEKCIYYKGSFWYDRAQVISEDAKTEYCASRRLPAGANANGWVYDKDPFVWAHWGEDGTDGDGIEYIFCSRSDEFSSEQLNNYWDTISSIDFSSLKDSSDNSLEDVANTAYNMDDYVPSTAWFENSDNRTAVTQKMINDGTLTSESPFGTTTGGQLKIKDNAWDTVKEHLSFNYLGYGLWEDNPGHISPAQQYQYVSIRKSDDKTWGQFSSPKLWSKYNMSKYTSFAFTATTPDYDLEGAIPFGGTFDSGLPEITKKNGSIIQTQSEQNQNFYWTDSPEPDTSNHKTEIWMTSATFIEGKTRNDNSTPPYPNWTKVTRMKDTDKFQIEWAAENLTPEEVTKLNQILSEGGDVNVYNFGNILKTTGEVTNPPTYANYDHDTAEIIFRNKVIAATTNNSYFPSVTSTGVTFGDDSEHSVLMATCECVNNKWTNWVVKNIKGETGERGPAGTSIVIAGTIKYELDLGQENGTDVEYTYANAKNKFLAEKGNLNPAPQEGYRLIVYPHSKTDKLYYGDHNNGEALYMWKYTNGAWVGINNVSGEPDNGETNGNAYTSLNGHLIVWDGDSWLDAGELQGPPGSAWKLVVGYANDDPNNTSRKIMADDIPSAKWVGTFTYLDDGSKDYSSDLSNPNYHSPAGDPKHDGWNWSLFKGQDGFGYEYIFKTTNTNSAPNIPTNPASWRTQANVVPNTGASANSDNYGWLDEPMEPTSNSRYVWMCWRKYNHSTREWTDFQGNSSNPGKARLWQVYAKSINDVREYFYAATVSSPSWSSLGDDSTSSSIDTDFWKSRANVTWNKTNRYLFNREVVVYSDNTMSVLDPHLVATYEDGILDVVDYYILESEDGITSGGVHYDPGEVAPHMYQDGITPVTTPPQLEDEEIAGEDYWTSGSVPKMRKEYPVLWNISLKTYENNRAGVWTTPLVIGTYGEGTIGEDAIYADLDNEMDSIQIDEDKTILTNGEYTTTIRLYGGSTMMRIDDIDISGEEAIMKNGYKLTYYYDDGTKKADGSANLTKKGEVNFTYNSNNQSFTPTTTDPIGTINLNINCIEITFTVTKNETLTNVYSKVVISVGHSEGNNETARRSVSYTFVGTTHPYVYSIVPKHSAIVFSNNTRTPNPLFVEVKRQAGTEKVSFDTYASDQGFDLTYTITHNGSTTNASTLSSGSFRVSTGTLEPGDYITFAVNVDNDDNHNDRETTLDRETVYVLREGEPGASGLNGTGYKYYYARYDDTKVSISTSGSGYNKLTNCTIAVSTDPVPNFVINGTSLEASTEAHGAEEGHSYEYRTERSGNDIDGWGPWTKPIIIAKYLTASNITQEVNRVVTSAMSSVNNTLNDATTAITELSGYFDNGVLQSSRFPDTVLNGYMSTADDVAGAINSIGVGTLKVSSTGQAYLSSILTDLSTRITTVGASYDNLNHQLTQYALDEELGEVASAFDSFKVDAHDQFASMDRTVSNVDYLKDTAGYLLVNSPDYTIWFDNTTNLNGAHKDPDERRDVTWVMFRGDKEYDFNGSNYGVIETMVPYSIPDSKLFTDDKSHRIVMLKQSLEVYNEYVSSDDLHSIHEYITAVTGNVYNIQHSILISYNVDDDNYTYSVSLDEYGLPANPYVTDTLITPYDVTWNTFDNSSTHAVILLYASIDLNNPTSRSEDSNGKLIYTYAFGTLTWNVGVYHCPPKYGYVSNGDQGTAKYAYAKTVSYTEEPLLPIRGSSFKYERTINRVNVYKQYGYVVTKTANVPNVSDGDYQLYITNGVLSIIPYASDHPMYLIPETESVQDIISFLNNTSSNKYKTTDALIPAGETKTYYVACKIPDWTVDWFEVGYNVLAPGGTNTVTYNSSNSLFLNKHSFVSGVTGVDFDASGYRTITNTSNASEVYSMYTTSKYDKVTLTFDNYSNISGLTIKVQYSYNNQNFSNTYSKTIYTGSGSLPTTTSIFENIDITPYQTLYFRLYVTGGSTYSLKYKFTTENMILCENAFDMGEYDIWNPIALESLWFGEPNVVAFVGEVDPDEVIVDPDPVDPEAPVNDPASNSYESTFTYKGYGHTKTLSVLSITGTEGGSAKIKFTVPSSLSGNLYYLVVPKSYIIINESGTITSNICQDIFEGCRNSSTFLTRTGSSAFLNNSYYGTYGINSWKTLQNNNYVYIDFTDKTEYTVIQYFNNSTAFNDFTTTVSVDAITNLVWLDDTISGSQRGSYCRNTYMIDKITVSINDKSRSIELPMERRRAKSTSGSTSGVKSYVEVHDSDKPYLIPSVSELATISQMVSDGIASTSIIAKAGDSTAVFFEQAVAGGGSQIYMNANDIGIESDYFHLNNNGLTLTGNLLAKNSSGKITAGVIGDNLASGIKFFAGTNVSETGNLSSAINNASFRVYEDGRVVATNATISGNIAASEMEASRSYNRNLTFDDDIGELNYSVTKSATMNSQKFEIASSATNISDDTEHVSKISIEVFDEFDLDGEILGDTELTTLTNVPVLCFEYDGNKYYLTPDVWRSFNRATGKYFVYSSPGKYFELNYEGLNEIQPPIQGHYMIWIEETNNSSNVQTLKDVWFTACDWTISPGDHFGVGWGEFHDYVEIDEKFYNKNVTMYCSILVSNLYTSNDRIVVWSSRVLSRPVSDTIINLDSDLPNLGSITVY